MQPSTETPFRDLTVSQFVERLASPEPVPGGGSASAIAAALGAGLVSMVAQLSRGRERYAAYEATLERALGTGDRLARRFPELADEDAAAYAAFAAALKLPRETAEEQAARRAALQAAARGAAEAPLACVEACLDLATAAESLAGRSNRNASSDVAVAALLAQAAGHGAAANVLTNLPAIGDDELGDRLTRRVEALLQAIDDLADRTQEVVAAGELRDAEPA
ncbi:MAG TPA: cyclodeaminase/cyclohydrolase family protein [Candidatus Limnocylindrales bacterium]